MKYYAYKFKQKILWNSLARDSSNSFFHQSTQKSFFFHLLHTELKNVHYQTSREVTLLQMTNFIGFIYSILILTNFHLFCKTKIRNTWKVKQKTNFKAWVCTINNYILISFPFTFILSLNPYMSHEISIPNYSYLTNTKDKHKSSPPKSWWCWWSICNWFLPSVTRTNGCCCNGILHESPCCPLTFLLQNCHGASWHCAIDSWFPVPSNMVMKSLSLTVCHLFLGLLLGAGPIWSSATCN